MPGLVSIPRQRSTPRERSGLRFRTPGPISGRIRTPRTPTGFKFYTLPGRIAKGKGTQRATFGLSIKTDGRFKSVAGGLSLGKAISLGAGITGRGPATTFKITQQKKGLVTGGIGVPKGFKKKKKGLIFVEKSSIGKGIKTGSIKI